MKRSDYNEFLYIRSTIRKNEKAGTRPIMWHINVEYSAELKQKISFSFSADKVWFIDRLP